MSKSLLSNLNIKTKKNNDKPYVCEFCGTGYTRESTILTHVCEMKRRHLAKDDKHVVLGFTAFKRYYQISHPNAKERTYDDFCKSQFYNGFIKFGSYVSNVRPLYPQKYIDYVVTSGVKLDRWCDDNLYYKYVLDLIRRESAETALERSVNTMLEWSEKYGIDWIQYFTKASPNRVIQDIKDGKISPWLILNSPSGQQMLRGLHDEQLVDLTEVLDITFWKKRFATYSLDLDLVKEVVKVSGL